MRNYLTPADDLSDLGLLRRKLEEAMYDYKYKGSPITSLKEMRIVIDQLILTWENEIASITS